VSKSNFTLRHVPQTAVLLLLLLLLLQMN